MPVDNALIHADSAPLPCAESEPKAPQKACRIGTPHHAESAPPKTCSSCL